MSLDTLEKEFLLTLQQRQKWTRILINFCIDDVVLLKDENLPAVLGNLHVYQLSTLVLMGYCAKFR